MPGLVDSWTSELTKLREKGQPIFSNSSAPEAVHGESQRHHHTVTEDVKNLMVRVFNKPSPLLRSEASVTMLVHCFSP